MEFEDIYITILSSFDFLWNSLFFAVLKFFVTVYVLVLFLDIVMILFLRGVGKDSRKRKYGADMPIAHRAIIRKKWKTVEQHIQRNKSDEWKVAILAADAIVGEVLEFVDLPGGNFRERVENADHQRLEQKDDLLRAHIVRNTIIKDHSFSLEKDEAREIIAVYRDFLERWEAL
jgi:hypothetical protein